jgi:peroxiredoxin Q/BCP
MTRWSRIGLTFTLAIGGFMLFSLLGKADELALGAKLPAVSGQDQDGKPVDLAAAGAKGWTLVYFYPKADTPGCTKQACSIRDAYAKLTDEGVRVFGVSADDVAAQKAFQKKYKLPFELIADRDKKVMDAFGVPHLTGFAKRQAYLFKDGELVWRDLAASTEKQAADVLAAIREHDQG